MLEVVVSEGVDSSEGELRWWKLCDIEVFFKVDGVGLWVVGEVVQGIISHQVEVPVLTPIITATVEVNEVLFPWSFEC